MSTPHGARGVLAENGAVYLEHLVLVVGVAIAVAVGCIALGLVLLHHHCAMETVLGLPIP